ncbi:MAG: cysteine desulfurase [Myxococcota bacterium]
MTVDPRWFPALGHSAVYLDSATTALMPQSVIDRVSAVLARGGSAGRSVHALGHGATDDYAQARATVARALGGTADEVVFVRSATEGLNTVAEGWAAPRLGPGDEVCVSLAEHHSNLLPWQRICQRTGATLSIVGVDAEGDLDRDDLRRKLGRRTRVLALTHVSNVTGALTDLAAVEQIVADSDADDLAVVLDGAQAMPHLPIDVTRLGCDFYVFSGHKVYGPPGVGVVWAKPRRWAETEPLLLGGGMVSRVFADRYEPAEGPARFEAGTPNVAAAAGLATALAFVEEHRDLGAHRALLERAVDTLDRLEGVRITGRPVHRIGAVSFVVEGVHAHDVASVLDEEHIAVRAGHHCAQPLLRHLGVASTVRASFGLHNRPADVERLASALTRVQQVFGRSKPA